MSGAVAHFNERAEFGTWRVEGHPHIEYSLSVLDRIRGLAVEGLNRFRRGGVEIGGLLLGTRQGNRLRIEDFRPLTCEHAFGPSFVLSEKDQEALGRLMEANGQHGLPSRFEVIGWYHSHTRSEINLSEQDLEIFERFFPKPWQIALVVRPANMEPTRFGYFLRESDGSIRASSSYEEFTILSRGEEDDLGEDINGTESPRVSLEEPADPSPIEVQQPSARRNWLWVSALVVVLGTIAAMYWMATQGSGAFRLHKAPSAKPDSIAQKRPPDPTEDAAMRARIQQQAVELKRLSELVETLSTPSPAETSEAKPTQQLPPASVEVPSYRPPPRTPRGDAQQLPPARVSVRSFRPPLPAPRGDAHRLIALSVPPAIVAVTPTTATPFESSSLPEIAPPAIERPAPQARRVYAGPSSGKIIWSGRFPRNATVTIDGRHASAGSVTGALPGVPVRIRVYPGDFKSDRLVLYAASRAESIRPAEVPGPQNGWNKTVYDFDAKRAGAVQLVEVPSPENGWKRIVLRNDTSMLSVAVLEWSLAQ